METKFIRLCNDMLYVIKKIKQHQQADVERMFNEVTKTMDFPYITKESLSERE